MKHCVNCNTDYESFESKCPSCGTVDAKTKCDNCGSLYESAFCPNCGKGINENFIDCPKCGNKTKDRICPKCGHDIAATNKIQDAKSALKAKAACLLSGHDWFGCKCKRCGITRNEGHQFQQDESKKGKCVLKCTVCGKTKEEHSYQPIEGKCEKKCSLCGKIKEEHDYQPIEGKKGNCVKICTICGKTKEKHDYQPVEGKCEQKCSACDEIEKLPHEWKGPKCKRCGELEDVWFVKRWLTILLIILFFPLGLYLMWKYQPWKKYTKIGITLIITLIIGVFTFLAIIIPGGSSNPEPSNEIKMPASARQYKGENYNTVVSQLEDLGFENIKTEELEDLITGWLTKDGEIEQISINGDTKFSEGDRFSKDAIIAITYHTFPEVVETTTKGIENTTEGTKNTTEATEQITEILEATFPVENAKRSAVVAITNAYATDVFEKDGNTYNISKFHSYADVSGYFMKVNNEGTWSAKDDHTWHVDGLILEISGYGTIIKAALDVSFDGTNYIISNVTGTIGKNLSISEIEANYSPYLTVFPSLIKDDRNQSDVEAQDHSDDLDKYKARLAFEHYGEAIYPYGFKCHWITALRAEEQASDGSWFFKVGVTITNQYGTKMDTIAECKIGGTTAYPVVKDFYVS